MLLLDKYKIFSWHDLCLPSFSLESFLESVQDLGDCLDVGVVAHHSNPPNLAGAGSQAS